MDKQKQPFSFAFSVDLEDWYQGIELPYAEWGKYERRVEKGLLPLLDLMDETGTKGTFFTLGWIAEQYPDLVRDVARRGHELASHGYSHEKVYDLTPDAFRTEIRTTRQRLQDLTGQPVTSHRSPFFSITEKSLWALDILAEEGYTSDCSISPVKTWRYGIASCPDEIFKIKENGLVEFPVSTFPFMTKKWAVGGAYFRLLPYGFTSGGIGKRLAAGQQTMFYIHPWEYDPQHPVAPMEWKAKLTHYTRLTKTLPYTARMLRQYRFDTVTNVINQYAASQPVREIGINVLKG